MIISKNTVFIIMKIMFFTYIKGQWILKSKYFGVHWQGFVKISQLTFFLNFELFNRLFRNGIHDIILLKKYISHIY